MSKKNLTTVQLIKKIRELLDHSTPGEWYACCIRTKIGGCHCGYIFAGEGAATVCQVRHNDPRLPGYEHLDEVVTLDQKNADSELIAILHNNIKGILDELEYLRSKCQ